MRDRSLPIDGLRLRDLCEWHEIEAECGICHHAAAVPLRRLKRKRADYVLLENLQKNLRCTECGCGVAKLRVRKMVR